MIPLWIRRGLVSACLLGLADGNESLVGRPLHQGFCVLEIQTCCNHAPNFTDDSSEIQSKLDRETTSPSETRVRISLHGQSIRRGPRAFTQRGKRRFTAGLSAG